MKDYHQNRYKTEDDGRVNIWVTLGAYAFIGCVIFYALYTF